MQTKAITPDDFRRSVIAVPPLCRLANGMPSKANNRRMISFLAKGGISAFLYGGNANAYHLTNDELAAMLDQIIEAAPKDAWVAPSIGPDFGKARDQVALIRDRRFPTAMLLPSTGPLTPKGVAEGVRRLTDVFGAPLLLYLRSEDYLTIRELRRLFSDGVVCGVKYAILRGDTLADDYLRELVGSCGVERIISGMGERPAIDHWRGFGIRGFTSGSVCIAPRLSMAMLAAMKAGRFSEAEQIRGRFLELEQLRDERSQIGVLHTAVATARIADTGPLTPLLSAIDDAETLRRISAVTETLSRLESARSGGPKSAAT